MIKQNESNPVFSFMERIKEEIIADCIENALPPAKSLIIFLTQEEDKSFIGVYQEEFYKTFSLELLIYKLKESKERTFMGRAIIDVITIIQKLQRNNNTIKATIKGSQLIQDKLLIKCIKQKILQVLFNIRV